jgi:multidrug transporter EmrE-like cation transporter
MRPYFRKHVMNTLDPHDFFFVNSFFISVCVILYFGYIYLFKNEIVKRTYTNCSKLTLSQIGSLILIAFITIASSLLFFHMEKYVNTPFINNIVLKGMSLIMLFLISYFIFDEVYHGGHLLGIGLTLAGITVLFFYPLTTKT